MMSSIFSRLSVFNNGSVWALYLLHVIILTALFCSLKSLSDLKPHDNMQYCRWGRIKLLYRILNTCWGRKRFNLHIIPSDLDILFDIFCTCSFHVKCWSIVKPKKLNSVTCSTEAETSSLWQRLRHWLHWRLSCRQFSVQPVMRGS